MKVLVIGSGGREHALVWKIKQSPLVTQIFCAPGNAGISDLAELVPIEATNIQGLSAFSYENHIDLTVVGPEAALVGGIVDEFDRKGLKIFGPDAKAAQLEGSKVFSKQFMKRNNIPTADFQIFENSQKARHFLNVLTPRDFPIVIKADGLAAGKGVVICQNADEARAAIAEMMDHRVFQDAGSRVITEECLTGQEVSILAICDGSNCLIMESAQDHKRIFDEDMGPNTGGMGAYSPARVVSKEMLTDISLRIIQPTIQGMKAEGHPFKGILYAGLMLTERGPCVLEYNTRFGDPEAQALIPRLKNDLVPIMVGSAQGDLTGARLEWDNRFCVCVVMTSGGYPGVYETGKEITGLKEVKDKDVLVFHAGTKSSDGKIVTAGGRVLGVTALGTTVDQAIQKAYQSVEKIHFEKCFFRRDIGAKAIKKTVKA